jgi:hypothetical protein
MRWTLQWQESTRCGNRFGGAAGGFGIVGFDIPGSALKRCFDYLPEFQAEMGA